MGKLLSKENPEGEATGEAEEVEVPHEATGTVHPQPESEFTPLGDAKKLNEAFQSFGANEEAITAILANRSWEQRQEIRDAYQEEFKKSLLCEVEGELSGNYKTALEWLLLDPDTVRATYITRVINGSLTGKLLDSRGKDVLILEVVFPLTKTELQGLRKSFEKVSETQLFKEIEDKVTGPFKDWLVEIVKTGRNEGSPSLKAIEKDTQALVNNAVDTWSPDNTELQQLFTKQNLFHIFNVLNSYEKEKGEVMATVLEKVKEDFRDGFTVVITSCMNGYLFYADGLYQSMKGLGTNDIKLIYIMIDRCEYDLENVKAEFRIKYKKSLESFIKDDTTGDYKNLLLAILENKPKEGEKSE